MILRVQKCIKKALVVVLFIATSFVLAAGNPQPAVYQLHSFLPKLKGKKVGLVVNQTSTIGSTHLVDTLLKLKVNIKLIFAPEHGFRGDHSAGATVKNDVDPLTGLSIVSLYGKHKKPTSEQLKGIDLMIFDIQDVGVRFYTYISTLHYVMEACGEQEVPLLVLDRPNPNGQFIDGPVLKPSFTSFVGMHPIPVVHGLTVGELAHMINGEGWLANGIKCPLEVIKATDYFHNDHYTLPIPPSPNLPNAHAIHLYASLCFFEGTAVSLGRGTHKPFQSFGFPQFHIGTYSFTPLSIPGVADNPPHKNVKCKGFDLTAIPLYRLQSSYKINIDYLIIAYDHYPDKKQFFDHSFFDKLAGTDQLRLQIIQGLSAEQIRNSWTPDLKKYQEMRNKYLLYPLRRN
jgi:uncharacterized protein YbbC (DUF1343 family)